MKLIIGLGNPGKKYEGTRHNVGWLVLDRMVQKLQAPSSKLQKNSKFKIQKKLKSAIWEEKLGKEKVVLAKPLTFMNNSGEAVKLLTINYQLSTINLFIIHDDLDIPLGSFKIQFAKGPREHKGVESVERALSTKDFWRVRVGIEGRMSNVLPAQAGKCQMSNVSGEEYVLGEFTAGELRTLEKTIPVVIAKLIECVKGTQT